MMPKIRLDRLLVERDLCRSREQAQRLIMAGVVFVNEQRASKAGQQVASDVIIRIQEQMPYVSRGGYKLAAALDQFHIDPRGYLCADVGASTGGFTDVLLQRGAAKIYAIDVGYGQLDWALRQNPRVIVFERTNARHLSALPERIQLVTVDASFISLRLLLPTLRGWLVPEGLIIALVKPQFEGRREDVGKGGIIRGRETHRRILSDLINWTSQEKLGPRGLITSPLLGAKGNREFLLWLQPDSEAAFDITREIESAL